MYAWCAKLGDVQLGDAFGHGGNGVVRYVVGHRKWLAKLPKDVDPHVLGTLQTKLSGIDGHAGIEDILFDRMGGKVIGFLMPKASGIPLHEWATKRHLVDSRIEVACWMAKTVAEEVSRGAYRGDLHPGQVLLPWLSFLKKNFIDCDGLSFDAARDPATGLLKDHHDMAGVPEYVAPERHGKRLPHTKYSVSFGLAVNLYTALVGHHPCENVGGLSALDNMRRGWYGPLSANIPDGWKAPKSKGINPLSLPADVRFLFKQTFDFGHKYPELRPSPDEWHKVLAAWQKECERPIEQKIALKVSYVVLAFGAVCIAISAFR